MKKFVCYAPRILAILYIAFLSIFALDVFGQSYSFGELIVALFMHLIPSLVFVLALVIAWKKPLWGGVIFWTLGLVFTVFFRAYEHLSSFLLIILPLFVIGGLFLTDYYLNKK